MVALAQDWSGVGHTQHPDLGVFFDVAPWIFGALVLALLLQALATRRRYRAVDVLSAVEQERVRATIAGIEARTVGEIVPLVVERSDPHTHTLLLGAGAFAFTANLALLKFLPQQGFLPLALAELCLLLVGLGLAQLCPDFRRSVTTERTGKPLM